MIEKFENMRGFQECPGSKFICPDNSIWTFVQGQESPWSGFQWNVYESTSHPGILVWKGYCGDSWNEEYQCDCWTTWQGEFIYLSSIEVWKEGIEKGEYQ